MNMNKKIIYLIIIAISFICCKNNVYADECSKWQSSKVECESHSVNGKMCEYNGTLKGGSRCKIGKELAEEEKEKIEESIEKCSELTSKGSETCNNSTVKGKNCIYRQGVCTDGLQDDGSNDTIVASSKEEHEEQKKKYVNTECKDGYERNSVGVCIKSCPEGYYVDGKECKEEQYVLNSPCSEDDILHILHFLGYLLFIAKFMVPLLIIGFGTFDLFKAVIDKDEKSFSKQIRIVGIRVIIGLIVFFLPAIVYAIFDLSTSTNTYQDSEYQMCADCLLKPTKGNCNYD